METCDLLIEAGLVLALDAAGTALGDGAIAVRGRDIVAVGPAATLRAAWAPKARIGGRDRIALPGLVNVHNHTPLMVTRGMIEDIGYAPAYTKGVPQGHRLSAEEAHLLSRLGMYEALRAGCTTVVDYYRYPEGCASAAAELGLRATIAGRVHDADSEALSAGRYEHNSATRDASLAETEALIARWHGHDEGRIACEWAPHAPDTCSRGLLAEIAARAAKHGGNVHTHLAQGPAENGIVRAREGLSSAELYEATGLLDRRLIAAHCIFLDDADVARCGRTGIVVAHAPIGNARSGMAAPILALRDAGARIALCTDTYSGDLFEAMRWAISIQRVREGGRFVLSAAEVLGWATRGGAAAIGRADRIGSIETGKRADVILMDATSPRLAPVVDGVGIVVHSASGNDVVTAVVDGRVVLENGRPTLADGAEIVRSAQAVAARAWRRAGYTLPA
jgi:5-methylthioadenosine/S-adenosylhomocysteine deaminase